MSSSSSQSSSISHIGQTSTTNLEIVPDVDGEGRTSSTNLEIVPIVDGEGQTSSTNLEIVLDVNGEGQTSSINFERVPDGQTHAEATSPSQGGGSDRNARTDVQTRDLLYLAAVTGDWEKASSLITDHPEAVRVSLTRRNEIALHIAAAAQQTKFALELVERMKPDELTLQTETGYRALCFAAISGTVKIAKALVRKNDHLPLLRGYNASFPLYLAVIYRRKDMADYLLSQTDLMNSEVKDEDRVDLLHATILSDYYDIGLKILQKDKKLAVQRNSNGETALHALARRPHAFGRGSQLGTWKKFLNSCFKGIYSEELMRTFAHQLVALLWRILVKNIPKREVMLNFINTPLLDDAAKVGNAEFLTVLISLCPDLIKWNLDNSNRSIFHIAIESRQEGVFKLIHEIGGLKYMIAKFSDGGNENMLELAAKSGAHKYLERVSNPVLQLQREVQWFKEVEKIAALPYSYMTKSTSQQQQESTQTPRVPELSDLTTLWEIFEEKHEELRKIGEDWMRRTSNSFMLVATLIATVVFAATFTVPGGNNDQTGIAIFRKKGAFQLFLLTDTLALISSSISILIFLSILTSRFAQEDFLKSLPRKLFLGLATLLISIACMDAAFGTAVFLVYDTSKVWTPWLVGVMALLPVLFFFRLEHSLLAETFRATFGSVFKPRQRNLFSSEQAKQHQHPNATSTPTN